MVYKALFPRPSPSDPVDLQHHISRNLVAEVRQEIVRFYGNHENRQPGSVDYLECRYPGLDYTFPGHRLRLNAYQWHRRLFRAFDQLRLSNDEINTLCTWEGTKWAKDKYENDHRTKIRDTTWDEIEIIRRVSPSAVICNSYYSQFHESSQYEDYEEDEEMEGLEEEEEDDDDVEEGEVGLEEDSEEDLVSQSVGVALNQRLLAASEARARGEEAAIDPDWEQWMKEAAERGSLSVIDPPVGISYLPGVRRSQSSPRSFSLGSPNVVGPTLLPATSTPRLPQAILPASRLRMSTSAEAASPHSPASTVT